MWGLMALSNNKKNKNNNRVMLVPCKMIQLVPQCGKL